MRKMEGMKRLLGVLMCLGLLWGIVPTAAYASDGLCPHHQTHTAACKYAAYQEGSECSHIHGTECSEECTHSHDEDCGYRAAVEAAECQYDCGICRVQALVNALPDDVTEENARTVGEQLSAIDAAKSSLDAAELDMVDFAKYDKLADLLSRTVILVVGEHGNATASRYYAAENARITLTITPDKGYELEELTVKDQNENPVTVTDNSFTMPKDSVYVRISFREHPHEMDPATGKCGCGKEMAKALVTAAGGSAVYFEDLDGALDGRTDGDTVTLLADSTSQVTVDSSDGTITVDLSGYSLSEVVSLRCRIRFTDSVDPENLNGTAVSVVNKESRETDYYTDFSLPKGFGFVDADGGKVPEDQLYGGDHGDFTAYIHKHTFTGANCKTPAACACGTQGDTDPSVHISGENEFSAENGTITERCGGCAAVVGTATITNAGGSYQGEAYAASVSGTGTLAEEAWTVAYAIKDGEALSGAPKAVGTYTASITKGEATAFVEFTIGKKQLTPILVGTVAKTYDASTEVPENHTLEIQVDGIVANEDVSVTANYAYAAAKAGTVTVNSSDITLSGADCGNYELASTTVSADVGTIAKAAPTEAVVFPTASDITYGQTLSESNLTGGKGDGTFRWTAPEGTPLAGKGNYAVDFIPNDAQNYDYAAYAQANGFVWIEERGAVCDAVPIMVHQAKGTVTKAPEAVEDLSYSGKNQPLVTAGQTNAGKLLYSLDGKTYSEEIPQAADVGDYTVSYYIPGDENVTGTEPKLVKVTMAPLDITGKAVEITLGEALTYNGKAQTVTVSSVKLDGMEVTCTVSGNTGTDAGEYTLTVTGTGSFQGTATAKWRIAQKELTVTAKEQTIAYGEAPDAAAYTYGGQLDGHTVTAELVASTTDLTGNGTLTPANAVVKEGALDVTKNYAVRYVSGSLVINPDLSALEDLTLENVTSDDREAIGDTLEMLEKADTTGVDAQTKKLWQDALDKCESLLERLDAVQAENDRIKAAVNAYSLSTVKKSQQEALKTLLSDIDTQIAGGNLTQAEEGQLKDQKKQVQALIRRTEEAQAALDAETIRDTAGITADNVKLEDKADIQKAIADMENALALYSGNYTAQEEQALQTQLDTLEEALESIERVETVTAAIKALPASVEPDDEETAEDILDAQAAYDALSEHEKTLVPASYEKKLSSLLEDLTDYKVIKGSGGKWNKGSITSLYFTANGPYSKFEGIQVDGKDVSSAYYSARSGSTVVRLRSLYLYTLSEGKHTLTIQYTDGEAECPFYVQARNASPGTGDDFNMGLWMAVLGISAVGLVAVLIVLKRKK